MSVKRDPRTGGWFFRTTVKYANGTRKRIYGTPGAPGRYHDLPNTKAGALEAERRAIAEALHGKPIAQPEATATKEAPKTIREHATTFLEHYKPESKPAARRDRQCSLDGHLLPFFGDMTIDELKQTDVDAFARAELERGVAVKTINNRLAVLSSLIKYVTGQKSRLRFKLAGKGAEVHAVDPSDVERLLAACTDDRHRTVILLASEAGLRVGEIRGLQWTDVKDGQLTVRRALDKETGAVIAPKHNKVRTIPLSPRIVAVLATLPKLGLWVVSRRGDGSPLNYYELSRAVNAIYDRAKVARPPWPLHCMRHSFGTVMAKRVPLGVLQQLMGHNDVQTTMRYVDVSEADKREAIASVFGTCGSQAAAERERAS
jgi:integrase